MSDEEKKDKKSVNETENTGKVKPKKKKKTMNDVHTAPAFTDDVRVPLRKDDFDDLDPFWRKRLNIAQVITDTVGFLPKSESFVPFKNRQKLTGIWSKKEIHSHKLDF